MLFIMELCQSTQKNTPHNLLEKNVVYLPQKKERYYKGIVVAGRKRNSFSWNILNFLF